MKRLIIPSLIIALFLPFWTNAETCYISVECGSCVNICNNSCDNGGNASRPPLSYGIEDRNLYNSLRGRILILPERNGEAYYVHPSDYRVYYLGNATNALEVMQSLGYGTFNRDLWKIPAGVLTQYGTDSDRDGLSDNFEIAFGTNRYDFNSDHDVYSDKTEIIAGYDPNGPGKMPIDRNFTNKNKGRVLLETESFGQAWYVNPTDGKRYYFSNTYEMHDIIAKFGLGISNGNFNRLVR